MPLFGELFVSEILKKTVLDPKGNVVMFVDSRENKVEVLKPEYFDIAMRLATTYEERIEGKEFTVKKQY